VLVESCGKLSLDIPVAYIEAAPFESIPIFSKYPLANGNIEEQIVFALKGPFATLLESSTEGSFLMIVGYGGIFRRWNGLPCFHFGYLIGEMESLFRSGIQLLDWFHWKSVVT